VHVSEISLVLGIQQKMRLLKACSVPYELVEFPPDNIPPYAILSHTWGADEVLYADIKSKNVEKRLEAAYKKVYYTCEQAKLDKLEYAWIDTCCIDKSSSAELSEAINSMYLWYKEAKKCYAYLADVSIRVDLHNADSEFAHSKWFTRGWTLQELLAPSNVMFYSSTWDWLGEKITLCGILSEITGIDEDILLGTRSVNLASVAKRISWASRRRTTRPEDRAYSLMGIFSVNMPMLYGEGGENAFLRLQEEIMKYSDDHSIFAWIDDQAPSHSYHGLLAKSPANFRYSNDIIPYEDREVRSPFVMSNRGLRIDFHLTRLEEDLYVAAIDCPVPPDFKDSSFLAIYLKKLSVGDCQYARVRVGNWGQVDERGNIQTIYVRQVPIHPDEQGVYPHHIFQLRNGPAQDQAYHLVNVVVPPSKNGAPPPLLTHRGPRSWIPSAFPYTFRITKGANRLAGAIILERNDEAGVLIMLGSSSGFQVGFDAMDLRDIKIEPDNKTSFQKIEDLFEPNPFNTYLTLDRHRVRANAEPRIHSAAKYYMVDIHVEPVFPVIPIIDPIIDILEDTREDLTQAKNTGIKKFRRLFGKS
jgi:hypothetical protein